MLMKSYVFRLIIMCTIGMLPLLGYSGSAAAANVGIIKGTVTGQRTNASMIDVNVQVMDTAGKLIKSAKTQKNGTFTVSQIPVGQYKVKAGNAPAKSIQVAMSPPVTQVDFQVPERGYLVFSGLTTGTIFLIGIGVAALAAGMILILDDGDSHNRVVTPTS